MENKQYVDNDVFRYSISLRYDVDWAYGFSYDLSCDYGPSYPLYLILYHAGVEKNDIGSICPWKTSIKIREVDNSVQYYTYQHMEDL